MMSALLLASLRSETDDHHNDKRVGVANIRGFNLHSASLVCSPQPPRHYFKSHLHPFCSNLPCLSYLRMSYNIATPLLAENQSLTITHSKQCFQVPEIAALICSFSTTQICARLLRTDRILFRVAVPFVWAHVDGVQRILALIDRRVIRYRDTCIEIVGPGFLLCHSATC